MSLDDVRKQKARPQPKSGLKQTLEGALERLGEELDRIAEGIRRGLEPARPQPVPIPVPVNRPRRR